MGYGITELVADKVYSIAEVGKDFINSMRFDSTGGGYFSAFTGLGGKKDRTTAIDFVHIPRFIDEVTVDMLYGGDAIAGRIVDSIVDDALAKGWSLKFNSIGEDGGVEPLDPIKAAQLNTAVESWSKTIELKKHVDEHLKRGRGYGGGILLFGLDDGTQEKSEPVKDGGTFDWMRFFSRHEIQASFESGADAKEPITFGLPITYTLYPRQVGEAIQGEVVHASRVFRYEGIQISNPQDRSSSVGLNDTFGDSVFERVWNPLKNWNSALQGAGHIVQDFAQAIYSVDQFRALMRAEGGKEALLEQFNAMDMFRSMFNATVVDAADTYERKTTSVTGMPELIDKFGLQLSAASGMPLTRLLGISPGGFGTGEAEQDNWNNTVDAFREDKVRPLLERIFTLLFNTTAFKGKVPDGGWTIVFPSLKPKSDKDQAEIQKLQSETDTNNINNGMLTPDEGAASRFGAQGFSLETNVKLDDREGFENSEGDDGTETEPVAGTVEGGETEDVAKTAMNGAQITGMVDIVKSVALKELPRDSAINILQVGFQLSPEDATAVIGSAGEGFDETEAAAKEGAAAEIAKAALNESGNTGIPPRPAEAKPNGPVEETQEE